MSERELMTTDGQITTLTREQVEKHTEKMTKEERKALAARVLSRGIIIDATTVENLPPHLHGEWVHRNSVDVTRMQALGFWVDTEFAPKRSMHGEGGGDKGIVGDTVFMVTSRDNKNLIDEIRHEEYEKMHGKPGETRSQKEEREYRTQVEVSGLPTPIIEESSTRQLAKDELVSILSKDKGGP